MQFSKPNMEEIPPDQKMNSWWVYSSWKLIKCMLASVINDTKQNYFNSLIDNFLCTV